MAPKIAIACQGGGVHTAFTAGVLQGVLEHADRERFEVVALTGTSGGAICALLTWAGLLVGGPAGEAPGPRTAREYLRAFWTGNAATEYLDIWLNYWVVQLARLRAPELSPYDVDSAGIGQAWDALLKWWELVAPGVALPWVPSWRPQPFTALLNAPDRLRLLLRAHVDFERVARLQQDAWERPARSPRLVIPRLLIGAVDVLEGVFKVFDSDHADISLDAVLASATLPTLTRAVHIDRHLYWDGLFSQNPPIHDILRTEDPHADKPDEIWVIQTNPEGGTGEPRTIAEIIDRRNELSGNLSLNQEIRFIKRLNQLAHAHPKYKVVKIRRILMSADLQRSLDYVSKLDRGPANIRRLLEDGERQGRHFAQSWDPAGGTAEQFPVDARALSPADETAYVRQCQQVLEAFADHSRAAGALGRADRLALEIMRRRRFPSPAEFGERWGDIEAEYPLLGQHFPPAHAIASRNGHATPEQLQAAREHYAAVFEDLVRLPEALRA
jgi:NTE family protein